MLRGGENMVHGSRIIRVPQKTVLIIFPPYGGELEWRSDRKSNEANQDMLATRGPKVGE